MRLYTIEAEKVKRGIKFEWETKGYISNLIVKIGDNLNLTLSPPYPLDPTVLYGHVFPFGTKLKSLYLVNVFTDLGFGEAIVFAKPLSVFSFSSVFALGNEGCLAYVPLSGTFTIGCNSYINTGKAIKELI